MSFRLFFVILPPNKTLERMIYIALPTEEKRRLPFYLAMEEYIAKHLNTANDCFFMWQVRPTVIFGRNQLIAREVNLDYCRKHHIETYRRKSGGGCVYADMSNIMFSYITRSDQVQTTFSHYIGMIVSMLLKLGVPAETSGRNDILVEGKKVSGNAFYHTSGHSIVHGTMLYDTDMRHMMGAITPSDEKLLSKSVESVRQHITLLKSYTALTLNEFKDFAKVHLCDKTVTLTAEDISCIEQMEKEYLSEDFIYGNDPKYTILRKRRIEHVGELEIHLELKNNTIRGMNIMGDFFVIGDINTQIVLPLIGCPLNRDALEKALPEHLSDIILHLQQRQLIDMLLGNEVKQAL